MKDMTAAPRTIQIDPQIAEFMPARSGIREGMLVMRCHLSHGRPGARIEYSNMPSRTIASAVAPKRNHFMAALAFWRCLTRGLYCSTPLPGANEALISHTPRGSVW